jgi:hypothetical protein
MGERIESEGLFSTYRLFSGIPKLYNLIANGAFKNRDKLGAERQLAFVSVKSPGNDPDAKHFTELLQISPDFEKYQETLGHFFQDGELKHEYYNKVAFIGMVDRVQEPFINSSTMTYLKNSNNYMKLFGKTKEAVLSNASIRPYYNARKDALYFGKGAATKLMSHIINELDKNGVELIVLHAMTFPLTEYYKGFGFIPLYNIRHEVFEGFYNDFGVKRENEVNKNIPVVEPGSEQGRQGPLMFRLRPRKENVHNINPFSQQNKNSAEAFFKEPVNGGFKKYRGTRKTTRKSRKTKKFRVRA